MWIYLRQIYAYDFITKNLELQEWINYTNEWAQLPFAEYHIQTFMP